MESDSHPDLSDCKGPKTETALLCRKKYIEDSDDDEEEFSEEFYESPSDDASETCHESDSKGKKRKKQLSSFELSEIIVTKGIKTRTQLLAYANKQKCEGKNNIAEFIVNRGPRVVSEVLITAWEMRNVQQKLERSQKTCVQILEEAAQGECIDGCNGQSLACACEMLQQNGI